MPSGTARLQSPMRTAGASDDLAQTSQEAEKLHQATILPSPPHGTPLGTRWRAAGTRVFGDACGPLDAFHGPGDPHRCLAAGPTMAPMEAWHSVHLPDKRAGHQHTRDSRQPRRAWFL